MNNVHEIEFCLYLKYPITTDAHICTVLQSQPSLSPMQFCVKIVAKLSDWFPIFVGVAYKCSNLIAVQCVQSWSVLIEMIMDIHTWIVNQTAKGMLEMVSSVGYCPGVAAHCNNNATTCTTVAWCSGCSAL